jgi:hypothetical protein
MKSNLSDLIVDGLKNITTDIEKLRVQITLGKYEARDLFENVKKDLRHGLHEIKEKFDKVSATDETRKIINGIEHLRVQLALGIAETEDIFNEQKKKIDEALSDLEKTIKSDPGLRLLYAEMHLQLEKFKMKVVLLSMQFRLKKISTQFNWEDKKEQFNAGLEDLRKKLAEKESKAKERFDHFQEEMNNAFEHVRKAFDPSKTTEKK